MHYKGILTLHLFGRAIPTFLFLGTIGYVVGVGLGFCLAWQTGLPLWAMVVLCLVSALTFFVLAFLHKIITGHEELIYYHHEIAIMTVSALVLRWVLHQPVVPFLEITLLGIGTFLAFGRLGCLNAGCCHGRPYHPISVIYGDEHRKAGFTAHYVGIRLFPIQLVESVCVFLITGIGAWLFLAQQPTGTVLGWYTFSYGTIRFLLEFFRGDPDRPYRRGFSEAQWTTLLLMLVVLLYEGLGQLAFHTWHWLILTGLLLLMVVLRLYSSIAGNQTMALRNPHHVREIADILSHLDMQVQRPTPAVVKVWTTSLGYQLSGQTVVEKLADWRLFSLSCKQGSISQSEAQALSGIILQLRLKNQTHQLVHSPPVYHLLVPEKDIGRESNYR
ncbi:prolipoprotein diacylglyceryl transferase family protein [Spirosoma pollinicola]|uniref:Prolipoprotein diacylglyceryl transferase n=1 Tax=Spirosoma pollinicola TaxID=2057025 RepID=A0A2K8Z4V9_9BACT|nr:prolipoprotein diacylglyceryl transferase family protein [Spirosoma pollinicola]AUD04878.1 hypothetical protein CWM47_25355 [Spirosoma pollinicola]